MKYVYVILRHDHVPDELAVMKAWKDRPPAEAAAKKLLEITGCLQTAIEVRSILCS